MDSEFLPYQYSALLEKHGFDKPCFGFYWHAVPALKWELVIRQISSAHLGTVLAPLWQQAFEFIRTELGYHVEIIPIFGHNKQIRHYRVRINDSTRFEFGIIKTYEVARESALDFILSKLD